MARTSSRSSHWREEKISRNIDGHKKNRGRGIEFHLLPHLSSLQLWKTFRAEPDTNPPHKWNKCAQECHSLMDAVGPRAPTPGKQGMGLYCSSAAGAGPTTGRHGRATERQKKLQEPPSCSLVGGGRPHRAFPEQKGPPGAFQPQPCGRQASAAWKPLLSPANPDEDCCPLLPFWGEEWTGEGGGWMMREWYG